jgi:acyl-CoA synthetase (NDP forming)
VTVRALFEPGSVAVYGASGRPGSMGLRAVRHLVDGGFAGTVVPVNRRHEQVGGLRCWPSLTAYGAPVDHAVLAVPAQAGPEVLRECAAAGVRAVTVLAGGYAEAGEGGRRLQSELLAVAGEAGIRVLGPNCLGLANAAVATCLSPGVVFDVVRNRPGPLAVVSQSGAIASDVLALADRVGLGVGLWVATGNEGDVTVADALDYVNQRGDWPVVAVYLEGLHDAEALKGCLRDAVASGRTVLVLRSGRTTGGRGAVLSHTGSLVTEARYYSAFFAGLGVPQVDSVRELVDAARVAAQVHWRRGAAAVVTSSGGSGALALDAAEEGGVPVAELDRRTQESLRAASPFVTTRTPVDLTGRINQTPEAVEQVLGAVLDQADVSHVVMIHGCGTLWSPIGERVGRAALAAARRHGPERVVFVGLLTAVLAREFEDAGVSVFDDPVTYFRALATVSRCGSPADRPPPVRPPDRHAGASGSDAATLPEHDALDLLRRHGVAVVPWETADSLETLLDLARAVGYPVVAKAVLAGVAHKTELGAVHTGVADEAALRAAWRSLAGLAAARGEPPLVLLEPMLDDAVAEVLIGGVRNPVLGPFVAVGAGGVLAEAADDLALAPAPLTREQAYALVASLRTWPTMLRTRDGREGDLDELVTAVVAVSEAIVGAEVAGARVAEIEVNPFLLRPHASCAVDALVRLEND